MIRQQREAEEMLRLAKAIAEARHDEYGTVRIADALWIVYDVPMLGKRESNVLLVTIGGRTVLHAIIPDDDTHPHILDYHPDAAWRWAIRRAHAALEMELHNYEPR